MRLKTITALGAVVALSTVLFVGQSARSQGSGSSRANPPQQPRRPQTVEEFAADFWRFLTRPSLEFTTWKTTKAAAPPEGKDPHGASPKAYVNSVFANSLATPPFGSIVVREDAASDPSMRSSVSVMYRVQGTDPKNFDWYWLRFQPDGSLAKGEDGKPLAGRVTSCIECHQRAQGGDLVFSNDPSPLPATE
ncbi:MAG TPA: cytochrome P460 family protein [Pirellulales bacterium]|nr:cytochrome P460 family protein [Pirellulales bacterium]